MSKTCQRENYYNNLISSNCDNAYLNIWSAIATIIKKYDKYGIRYFDRSVKELESQLRLIRTTEGLSRCWGYASEILKIIADWRAYLADIKSLPKNDINEESINTEAQTLGEILKENLISLKKVLLEVLPAYIEWKPIVNVPDNQGIVDFLQNRANEYRAMGNPKFYAYDKVIDTISSSNIIVTSANCKHFSGVGPRISRHIQHFLKSGHSVPKVKFAEPLCQVANTKVANSNANDLVDQDNVNDLIDQDKMNDIVDQDNANDLVDQDNVNNFVTQDNVNNFVTQDNVTDLVDSKVAPTSRMHSMPTVCNQRNFNLAKYLWDSSIKLFNNKQRCQAWAWTRAANTVCATHLDIEENLEKLHTLRYIGEFMADTIIEFYSSNVSSGQCPKFTPDLSVNFYELNLALQHAGFKALADEIGAKGLAPQLKSHFKTLENFDPRVLDLVFTSRSDAPIARNWLNQCLVDELWHCNKPTGAINYYKAARHIAQKTGMVHNLENVKYVGSQMLKKLI